MDEKISKCIQNEVENLKNQLTSLADTLRKLDDNYRSLQNSYIATALQFSHLKGLVDYMAADAKKEAGESEKEADE